MEDDQVPPFAFSIGLYQNFNHPEVIIIGLKPDLMKHMVSWIGEDVKKGLTFEPEKEYADLLEGFNCRFRLVAKRHYDEYLGTAMWFYKGSDFAAIQCVWPTTKGYFPWDKKYPRDLTEWQPLLDH